MKKLKQEDAFFADYQRNRGGYVLRFLWAFRHCSVTKNKVMKLLYAFLLRQYRLKYGLEIPYTTKIGKGLYLGHAFNITINQHAVLGDNINLHKGVVIGMENRGKRKGCPKIGNCVWIGCNAVIVGKVTIGNDVLIAPNSYVNCDVPSHSVVFGNPCQIRYRDKATEGYVNNRI